MNKKSYNLDDIYTEDIENIYAEDVENVSIEILYNINQTIRSVLIDKPDCLVHMLSDKVYDNLYEIIHDRIDALLDFPPLKETNEQK